MTFHHTFRSMLAFAALVLAIGSTAAQPATGPADIPARTVLVLSSERSDLPSIPDFEKGLRADLAQPPGRTEFFIEYLDFGRFDGPHQEQAFVRYLRDRYAGRQVDVVVPFQESAFDFLLAHRAELFPGVPVVAAGVDRRQLEGRVLPAGVTGIPADYDYRRTLALALALQPDAREVVVVHGVSDYDLRRREEARRAVETFAPKLRYRALGGVPLAAIEEAVRGLPPESLVLLVSMVRDAEGRPLVGRDYVRRLAAVSPVPIYGTFPSHLESGTLGGAITDFSQIGRTAASAIARLFSAGSPPGPAVIESAPAPLRVNWRALERWHISPGRLPDDVLIAFREPGLWDRYRSPIIAAFATLLIQGLLITALMLQLGQRRRAESALRDSEENLMLAAEAAQLGMWGWTASREQMWATDGCRSLHGFPPGTEISFRTFIDRVDAADKDRLRRAVEKALEEKRSFAEEYRVTHAGNTRWIATRGQGFYGRADKPLRVLGVSMDVTERRLSEETLRVAIGALPTAIMLVDVQGTILLANIQAEILLGYEPGELTGQPIAVAIPDRSRSSYAGLRAAFFISGKRDVFAQRKDGAEIPVEVSLNAITARGETLVLAAITDLRERRALERTQEELEHVGRVSTMGEIAASLAHELSQPLAAILSNAQAGLRLFERGNPDQAEIVEILRDVVVDDKRAGEVIGALRTMLRRGKTERVVIDAADAVLNVLTLIHSETVKDQVEVNRKLDAGCLILANAGQLQQVLLNLLMNAVEAVRQCPVPERRLWVGTSRTGESGVQISIRDSGTGIPPGELEKVFDAFWTTKPHGMGMGLAVCRSIVRSHGGDIRAELNDDRGVTFVCTLPGAPQT